MKNPLDEITTTAAVRYMTPFAFSDGSKKIKRKRKKRIKTSMCYLPVNEDLDDKDVKQINKLIRDVVKRYIKRYMVETKLLEIGDNK